MNLWIFIQIFCLFVCLVECYGTCNNVFRFVVLLGGSVCVCVCLVIILIRILLKFSEIFFWICLYIVYLDIQKPARDGNKNKKIVKEWITMKSFFFLFLPIHYIWSSVFIYRCWKMFLCEEEEKKVIFFQNVTFILETSYV